MELNELILLLVIEGIEESRFEISKGIVSGCKEGHAIVGVQELGVYLIIDLGGFEETNESCEPSCLLENPDDISGGG